MLTGVDYKSGDGSAEVHTWLRLLSQSHAFTEAGARPEREFELQLAEASAVALARIVREASQSESSHG